MLNSHRIPAPPRVHYFEEIALSYGVLPCGIDEVGRGCLAGPLVVAAAMVYEKSSLIRDSKQLSPLQRLKAYEFLREHSDFGLGIVSARQIDRWGIVAATLWAMRRAIMQLVAQGRQKPAFALVDALPLVVPWDAVFAPVPEGFLGSLDVSDPVRSPWGKVIAFNHGETYSYSIAAASIIAKVTRDALMVRLSEYYPHYSFDRHKGYGTQLHQEAVSRAGRSLVHRETFACSV